MNLNGSPLVYDSGGTLVSGVKDSNGNQAGEGVNALDTLGRTIVTEQTGTNQYTYTVHDSNGAPQNYIVNLANQALCTQFGFAHVNEYCNLSHLVVTSIVLPTLRQYSFHYDPHFGDLTEIDLPTGAVITYTWQVVGTAGIPPTKNTAHRVISSRTVTIPGQTAQLWTLSGFTAFGGNVTVTDPLNNQSVYNVSMGTVLSAAFYNGSATGNPVRQYTMDYASGGCPLYFNHINGQGGGCGDANIGNRLIRVTTTLDNGQVSKREYDYETFTYIYHTTPGDPNDGQTYTGSRGNVSEIREYDYEQFPRATAVALRGHF